MKIHEDDKEKSADLNEKESEVYKYWESTGESQRVIGEKFNIDSRVVGKIINRGLPTRTKKLSQNEH